MTQAMTVRVLMKTIILGFLSNTWTVDKRAYTIKMCQYIYDTKIIGKAGKFGVLCMQETVCKGNKVLNVLRHKQYIKAALYSTNVSIGTIVV